MLRGVTPQSFISEASGAPESAGYRSASEAAGSPPLHAQAALSHLELALVNVEQQLHALHGEQRKRLLQAARRLRGWASDDVEENGMNGIYKPSDVFCQNKAVAAPISLNMVELETLATKQDLDIGLGPDKHYALEMSLSCSSHKQKMHMLELPEQGSTSDSQHEEVEINHQLVLPIAVSETPDESNCTSPKESVPHSHTWFREKFMSIFDELDTDKQGSIDHSELRNVFAYMGLPAAHAAKVFKASDENGDGLIDRTEWLTIVDQFHDNTDADEMHDLMKALADRYMQVGHIYEAVKPAICILRHDSRLRMLWDSVIIILLGYISISLPLTFGFGNEITKLLGPVDNAVDGIFMFDVLLNFRTTFLNKNMEVVEQSKAIACNYLKTWFILDFFSSVPLESVTLGLLPGLQPMKLLKVGKLVKVLKLLRFGKLLKLMRGSEVIEVVEEMMWSKHCFGIGKLIRLMANLLLVGHWFACILLSLEGTTMTHYFGGMDIKPTSVQVYLAALYWSMTTMTTVGYGDIVMRTDNERIFAVCAMIVGGAFYGYIIGSITTLVSQTNLNHRAFNDRMDLVMSWLDFHDELPPYLRRRIWRHFKDHLAKKTAVEDSIIMNDLSTSLKHNVCEFLMHDDVRNNPLFEGLPSSELSQLVVILEKVSVQPKEHICSTGEAGYAMFIIVKGFALMNLLDRGRQICAGDSFGEEILLQLRKKFAYTVVAETKMELFKISSDAFAERFKNRADLVDKMKRNFTVFNVDDEIPARPTCERGHASLLQGGKSGVPPSFPDAVFESLRDIGQKVDVLRCLQMQNCGLADTVSSKIAKDIYTLPHERA